MRFPPQVSPEPNFYQMFNDYPLFVDNPHLTQDRVGHTKCIVMVPKHYMVILIGYRGSVIKGLMAKNNIHSQTWNKGHVFVDRETYNLPVIWTSPMPCFIIFGLQKDVFTTLTELCEIIKNIKHIRYRPNRDASHGKDTLALYKEHCQKNTDYTEKVNLSLPEDLLIKKISQRISEYLPAMATTKVSTFISTQFNKQDIAAFLRDEDQLVSIIADAQFLLDSGNELTRDNLQMCREYDSHLETFTKSQEIGLGDVITHELTKDEQYEGEKFIFENQLCYDN